MSEVSVESYLHVKRSDDGRDLPALMARTDDGTLYGPLSSGTIRLLTRAGGAAGSRNLQPADQPADHDDHV